MADSDESDSKAAGIAPRNLAPGTETDRLVAEALGWKYAGFCRRGPVYRRVDLDFYNQRECGVDFRPSLIWDDAMEAVGFSGLHMLLGNHSVRGGFHVSLYGHDNPEFSAFADTGPLAICYAILGCLKREVAQ